jgi:hypothetical protein
LTRKGRCLVASLPLLALLGLAWPAPAAETPAVRGLQSSPEAQNALKERNLNVPGRLTGQTPGKATGQAPARTLGKMPPSARAKTTSPADATGQATPQSFKERHRLQPGSSGGQASRDVLLNRRIQGQRPASLQRVEPPAQATAPASPPPQAPAGSSPALIEMSPTPPPGPPAQP